MCMAHVHTYMCAFVLNLALEAVLDPYCLCKSKNKSAYVQLSLKSMVAKETELHKYLRVVVDGEELKLPSLEGLVLLNIQSWAAGADPWGTTGSEVGWWVGTEVVYVCRYVCMYICVYIYTVCILYVYE